MIFTFCKRKSDSNWEYCGEFHSIEEAEDSLTQYGEPVTMEYMAIRGIKLNVTESLPIYPVKLGRD